MASAVRWLALCVCVCLVGVGVVSDRPISAHKPTTTTYSYNEDIYPIFSAKCGSCHRSGGAAPMSLLTYKEAFPWAVSIKNEVLDLAMPPWYAEERFAALKHSAGLSATEVNTIVDWCLGGSPEGDTTLSVAASDEDNVGWPLGKPDLTLRMPSAFTLDESTGEASRYFVLPAGQPIERFIRAVDVRPGSPNIVRSVMVYVLPGASLTRAESVEGVVGLTDAPALLRARGQLLTAWIPGRRTDLMTSRGYAMTALASVVLQVHYKKSWLDEGTSVSDQTSVGLYFHPGAVDQAIQTLVLEPGGETELTSGVEILSLLPQLDGPVETLLAEAVLPDGVRSPILSLYQPSPEWPRQYELGEPIALPAGSHIEIRLVASPDGTTSQNHRVLMDMIPESAVN